MMMIRIMNSVWEIFCQFWLKIVPILDWELKCELHVKVGMHKVTAGRYQRHHLSIWHISRATNTTRSFQGLESQNLLRKASTFGTKSQPKPFIFFKGSPNLLSFVKDDYEF